MVVKLRVCVAGHRLALHPILDSFNKLRKNPKNNIMMESQSSAGRLNHIEISDPRSKHKNHIKSCKFGISTPRVNVDFFSKLETLTLMKF